MAAANKKAKKKKKSNPGQIAKSAALSAAERKENKKKQVKRIIGGVIAFFAFLIWFGLQPLVAGVDYGICRTYLEVHLKYPTSLNITQYDEFGKSLRIFYTYHDPFGNRRSEMIECIMNPHPTNGYVVETININRTPIDDEKLKLFNQSIPAILLAEPNRIIPRDPGKDLANLKRD